MKKSLGLTIGMFVVPALLLSGCGGAKSSGNTASNISSKTTNSSNSKPSTTRSSTTKPVTITFWNRLEAGRTIFSNLISGFEKQYPNVHVKLENLDVTDSTNQYDAAISSNGLPDVFTDGGSYGVPKLVQLKQLHSLNSLFPQGVKSKYPAGTFSVGYNVVGNNIYELPLYSGYHGTYMIYYNKDVLKKLGISVKDIPHTWSGFIKLGQEIYQRSNGKIYAFGMGGKNGFAGTPIQAMASSVTPLSGVTSGMDYKTGQYNFDTPGEIATFQFFKTMLDKHCLYPDSLNETTVQIQTLFAAGKMAFYLNGNWTGAALNKLGFKDWGVTPLPTKDGKPYYQGFVGAPSEGIEASAYTKHWPQVKLFLNYMIMHVYPLVVQAGNTEPAISSAVKGTKSPFPQYPDIVNLMNKSWIRVPNVYQRDPGAVDVVNKFETIQPKNNIGKLLLGYLTGQVKDPGTALKDLSAQYNQALSKAIAQTNGKATKNDWIFPNWVPFQPYTDSDYAQLKK